MKVRCNKCSYVADEDEFPKGHDFFQNQYVASCPKCDNWQSPGDASMRGFGGKRPFEYVRGDSPEDPVGRVLHRSEEAS
jgi:hypothetical protein